MYICNALERLFVRIHLLFRFLQPTPPEKIEEPLYIPIQGFLLIGCCPAAKRKGGVMIMSDFSNAKPSGAGHYVFSRYITRNGKKIYRPNGKVYRFWVKD